MVWEDLKPSDILTREAFENTIVVNSAIGGSTNAPIHVNAIARHIGVKLDDRRLGEGRPQGAAARQHAAGRQISRRGIPPRGRRAGRGPRADEAQAHPREGADRQRQDDRRELRQDEIRRPGRHLPDREAAEGERRLHRAVGQPVRRRDHEDERDRRGVPHALPLQPERSGGVRGPRDRVRRAGGLSPPHRRSRSSRSTSTAFCSCAARGRSAIRAGRRSSTCSRRRRSSRRASTRCPASAMDGSPARRARPRSSTPRPRRRRAAGSRC